MKTMKTSMTKNRMVMKMKKVNFNVQADYIGLSSEVASLPTDEDNCVDGSTFLAVDTGDLYILYQGTWYKL